MKFGKHSRYNSDADNSLFVSVMPASRHDATGHSAAYRSAVRLLMP